MAFKLSPFYLVAFLLPNTGQATIHLSIMSWPHGEVKKFVSSFALVTIRKVFPLPMEGKESLLVAQRSVSVEWK